MFMMPSEYTAYFDKEITHKVGDNADYDKLYGTADVYGPQLPDNSWHEANVRDNLYTISSWKDLKNILKSYSFKTCISSRFQKSRQRLVL